MVTLRRRLLTGKAFSSKAKSPSQAPSPTFPCALLSLVTSQLGSQARAELICGLFFMSGMNGAEVTPTQTFLLCIFLGSHRQGEGLSPLFPETPVVSTLLEQPVRTSVSILGGGTGLHHLWVSGASPTLGTSQVCWMEIGHSRVKNVGSLVGLGSQKLNTSLRQSRILLDLSLLDGWTLAWWLWLFQEQLAW